MKEWFKDWFSSDEYLSVYQHRNDDDAQKLLDLILVETNVSENASILDVACGAGRHTINLASKGFQVIGFDLSKSLLNTARQDAIKKHVHVNLFCGDLRKICLRKKFDLILNLFTSFGYFFSDEENFSFVKTAYHLLNKDCYYVFDFLNSNYLLNHLVPETVKGDENKKIIERRRIENNRVIKEISIQNGLIHSSYLESVQLYSRDKIILEFEKIGFKFVKDYGDYNGALFDIEKSQRLILFFKR